MKKNNFFVFLATVFYIGSFPVAPGTVASLAGAFLSISLAHNIFGYVVACFVVTLLGFLVCGKAERALGKKDPGCIVIDEVSGIMFAFFLLPMKFPILIVAFFVFRAFDMFKIYPSNYFESKHGSFGIMTDDIVAGIYTNIVMHSAIYLSNIISSSRIGGIL